MKKFLPLLVLSVLATTNCYAKDEKPAAAATTETVNLPAEQAVAMYNYLQTFPAKDVRATLDDLDKKLKPQLDAKKSVVKIDKAVAEGVLKALMGSGLVQLTVSLQQALQPPQAPVPAPKKEEAKK